LPDDRPSDIPGNPFLYPTEFPRAPQPSDSTKEVLDLNPETPDIKRGERLET